MFIFKIVLLLGHILGLLASPAFGAVISGRTASAASCGAHPESASKAPSGAVVVDSTKSTSGSFSNLSAALASLPNDSTCQTVFLMPGTYVEQASVNRPGQTVVIGYTTDSPGKGYSGNKVTISFSRGLSVAPLPAGHSDAETAVISTASSNVAFYNVNFINTENLDGATPNYVTLAASIYGSHIGFYGCNFTGWQDTLLTGATTGYLYYESCYIDGAIDFIWGYSAAYFKGCTIAAKKASSCITAHSRKDASGVGIYVFDQCLVTAAAGYESATKSGVYLGRPYSEYAKVVFKDSYLDSVVQPAGWKQWGDSDPRLDHVTFAEFNNTGPGNWENNAAARKGFGKATLLTSDDYPLSDTMDSTTWIDSTYSDSISTPSKILASRSANPAKRAEADSTAPAEGDYIISQSPIEGKTVYATFAEAVAAIQGLSEESVTVFVYPGTYKEQIVLSRAGTTIFRGYSDAPTDNAQNQVTLQNSAGVDTGADQSNTDCATLYSQAGNLQLYNINLANTFGQKQNWASLGFASGNGAYASLYNCQVLANQDTFFVGEGTSVFAYNTLVEGSKDFVWGAGSAYFLASTLAPNTDGGAVAAMMRDSGSAAGGVVFDQCTVAAAGSVGSGSVFLGRPYNEYSRAAYIKTNLDGSIAPEGWTEWTSSDPQTDGVLFGEYGNTGSGASTDSRAEFSTQLSESDAQQFKLASFFSGGTSWINMEYVKTAPF